MGFLGGPPAPPKVKPLPPAPRRDSAQDAAQAEVRRLRNTSGFTDTIATSPLGVVGSAAATSRSVLGYG